MIGVDTNVLVRYLAQDDPAQSPVATRFFERLTPEEPGYVSTIVLIETVWVLAGAYKATRAQIGAAIEGLLRAREVVVEDAETGYLALATYEAADVEFADAFIMHRARLAGCRETVTFDKDAAKELGMRLLR